VIPESQVKKGDNTVKKGGTTSANQYTKWHLKGTVAEGSFLHKPATVSGGGKSEISKRIEDFVKFGPVFTAGITKDFDEIEVCLKICFVHESGLGRVQGTKDETLTPQFPQQGILSHDYSKMNKDGTKSFFAQSGVKDFLDPKVSLGKMIQVLDP
jgi:hypothetical protein